MNEFFTELNKITDAELEAAIRSAKVAYDNYHAPIEKCCCGYEGKLIIDVERGGWYSCPNCGMI